MDVGRLSLGAALASWMAGAPALAQDDPRELYWVITPEAADCLSASLDAYRRARDEPIIIFLDACPETDPALAMAQLTQNNGSPRIGSPQVVTDMEGVEFEVDSTLFYTRDEVICLDPTEFVADGNLVRVPREPVC